MHAGLSYAAWHPVPTSNTAGEAGATGMVPGASSQIRRRFSAAFDGSPGGALGPPLAAPAAPTLDAIFLAKGPGPYLFKGAQVHRCAVTWPLSTSTFTSNAEQTGSSETTSVMATGSSAECYHTVFLEVGCPCGSGSLQNHSVMLAER